MADISIPNATYRVQFNEQFGFQDARLIIPYLRTLGISDLYASPLLKPRRGSAHGYDVVDPTQLNPELGAAPDFDALSLALQTHEMGLLLDIVPNHMAASTQNPWWSDVLENGTASQYARFFDIDWRPVQSAIEDKLLLPILGRPYGEALEDQELQLKLENDGIYLDYYETRLPLNIGSWAMVASYRIDAANAHQNPDDPGFGDLREIVQAIKALPSDPPADQAESFKEALLQAIHTSPTVHRHVFDNITTFNGVKGNPASFDLLDILLAQQAYQLAFWKTFADRINYRRFFDINDLAGLRTEDALVFEAVHAFVLRLIKEEKVTGLRIDHIDGLYDPLAYLRRLQSHSLLELGKAFDEQKFYVVVEKILTGKESLREDWPIAGTTGYEFLNALNGVFVDSEGFQRLRDFYHKLMASDQTFHDLVYEKKKQIMSDLFAGEVRSLSCSLARLTQYDRHALDIPLDRLTTSLIEVTACLPVYRTYIDGKEVSASDRHTIETSISEARNRNPNLDQRALNFLTRAVLLDFPARCSEGQQDEWLEFVRRWQQLTGPVMAKGAEDTALYNYNCLISLNDVGGEPEVEAAPVEAFHAVNQERMSKWPHTINATSTHDTKRSEDVRARINVLSEMPEAWQDHLRQWTRWNQERKCLVNGLPVPDANTELLMYQTMIGAWPLSETDIPQFQERLKAYGIKAAREAKVLTNWRSPMPDHEAALMTFVDALLAPAGTHRFMPDFLAFQKRVAFYGAINSLSQVLLKTVSPGVPDFYQGTELWDLSLVDPDNRRPVDFTKRQALLESLFKEEQNDWNALLSDLLQSWGDGRVKLYVTHKALHTRHANRNVFLEGQYTSLRATGPKRDSVIACVRHHGDTWIIAVAPRLPSRLSEVGEFPLGERVWESSELILPAAAPRTWSNVFTGERPEVIPAFDNLRLSEIFSRFPIALLVGTT
jgi:(1->4)-alpha-D-glucan 1-alpha-D-glucosylmutase